MMITANTITNINSILAFPSTTSSVWPHALVLEFSVVTLLCFVGGEPIEESAAVGTVGVGTVGGMLVLSVVGWGMSGCCCLVSRTNSIHAEIMKHYVK